MQIGLRKVDKKERERKTGCYIGNLLTFTRQNVEETDYRQNMLQDKLIEDQSKTMADR